MATQRVAFPDDHQDAGDLGVVRQSFNTHDSSDGRQRRNKLRTNHNCLHDSERIIGICAAVKIVLDFIRRAKLGDLALPFWDGAEHLETRARILRLTSVNGLDEKVGGRGGKKNERAHGQTAQKGARQWA